MTPEAETARKESKAHWIRMRDDPGCGEEPYAFDCALCQLFHFDEDDCMDDEWSEDKQCAGCPVYEKTRKPLCEGTPYVEAEIAWVAYNIKGRIDISAWRKAAQAEIDFLEELE